MKKIIFIIPLVLFFAPPARAQLIPGANLAPVTLTSSPSSPSPGETVEVSAYTPTFDNATTLYQWRVDGKKRNDFSGIGRDKITIIANKDIGSTINVSVEAIASNGKSGSDSISIVISDVALTWVASTYIPPWYKGKALPIQESVVTFIAIPNIILNKKFVPPENLLYIWEVNGEENFLRGVGENTLKIKTSEFPKSSYHIRLTVRDIEKSIRKNTEIFITDFEPLVSLHPLTSLGGIETRTTRSIPDPETKSINLQAEPFFFPVRSKRDLQYEWIINSAPISGPAKNPFVFTLNTAASNLPEISIVQVMVKSDLEYASMPIKTTKIFIPR